MSPMNRAQRASKIRWEKPYLRTKTDDESNYPCPRSGHTLTMVGSSGFLFGGICKDPLAPCNAGESKGRPLDELHVAHIGKAEIQWCRLHLPKDLRPLARWRHSACLINETQIVIFGGHHAPNLRLNDLWIFDSISMEWTQPGVPQTPGIMSSESYSRLSQHCVPSARGGHTASVIGRYIYVFGGYGGHGYARKDHDDVHRLFVDSWTWSRVETKGKKPEKRCGHGATAVEKHLFVWGGWNASTQFSDVFVLDVGLDVPVWSSVDALPEPRWHAAACAVEATPYSKIFVFGGAAGPLNDKSNRLGAPRGDLSILDTGTLHWTVPTVSGEDRPQPRCDATLAFDTKSCKLVLFGGWSNEWLGDLYMLDVGHVVGPPYSVIDLYPSTGPVTGGFAVEIAGYDFVDSTDVVIRFASKNPDGGTVDVNGAFVSKTQLNCTAPDFSMYPTGEVQVRVAINKDSFTTTFRHFTFFPVTDAAWTLIYGPGVLSGGLCGEETTFFIQARDKHNANRTAGGDEFEVSIQQIGGRDDGEDLQLRSGVMVQDNENGCYDVSYTAPSPGEYSVEVVFLGTNRGASGAVRGSGVIVEFVEIAPRSHNSLTGKLVKVELDHDVKFITELIDKVRLRINSKPYSESFDDIQNREALASVKEHIDLLYERKMDLELAIDRAECTLEALNAAGVGIGLQRDLLKFQQEAYAACKRDAPKIEAAIAPLLRSQQTRTRDEIDKYQANVEKLVDTLRSGAYSKFSTGVTFATDMINNAMAEYEAELARHNEIVRRARLFGCMEEVRASVDLIDMAGATLCGYRDLWTCAAECEVYLKEAGELTWDEVDPKGLEDNARLILKKVHSQSKLVKRSDAYSCLEASAMDFLATCPLVASLKQPVIQARHWRQLREFVKKSLCNSASSSGGVFAEIHGEFDPETCKLREFLNLKMHLYADRINHMIDEATSEARQEETLVAIAAFWESTRFIRSRFGESTVEFLALSDDASGKLESDQVALDALITSRIGCMQEKAKEWKAKLVTVENAVILLRDVQTLWSRLEPFLNDCEEIMIDLPETSESFRELDKHVKKCLCQISAASGTVLALTCDGMIERLTETLSGLEKGQRDLGLFLNKKRRTFPRFYFICEDALLAILACGSNPKSDVIARSVPDLFPATASFRLEDDGVDIQKRPYGVGFASILGDERVAFDRMVRLVGNVEAYFKSLHVAQESALRKRFQLSLERYPKQKRSRWAQETDSKGNCIDPTQIALLVAEINYVSSAEEAMKTAVNGRHDALQEYAGRHIGDLHDLVLIARTKLTKPERTRLTSLICQDSHGRDVLQRLLTEQVVHADTFIWWSQLKWRMPLKQASEREIAAVDVDICGSTINYGFEYFGNGSRIVVTPLTEKCFVAALFALRLNLGCALAGPATGKTETINALAMALGKPTFRFCCSALHRDHNLLGCLFKGLAASGSWLILENFNCLEPSVLSVCVGYLHVIHDGWIGTSSNAQRAYIDLDGDCVILDPRGACLITTNLACLEDESRLPHMFHLLFRPIAMLLPKVRLICEVLMMAQGQYSIPSDEKVTSTHVDSFLTGFVAFEALSSKLHCVYSKFKDLLSNYDWSLHSIKAVLIAAGNAKFCKPDMHEAELLRQVIQHTTRPKLRPADEEIAEQVLNDTFPSVRCMPRFEYDSLHRCILEAIETENLWPRDDFRLKVAQLDELLSLRHYVYITGLPGSGKTTIWNSLKIARTIKDPDDAVVAAVIYPKIYSPAELFGRFEPASGKWRDGAFAFFLRNFASRYDARQHKWMVLDGEVDSTWTDTVSSMMDQAMTLTLTSNERLILPPNTRLLHELCNLSFASPAAISRATILYVHDDGQQWRGLAARWMQSQPDEQLTDENRTLLASLFEKYIATTLDFLRKTVRCRIFGDVQLIETLLLMLEAVWTPSTMIHSNRLEANFAFCCVWAFEATLAACDRGIDNRKLFSDWWRQSFTGNGIPAKDTVFDYWLEPATGAFETWRRCPSFSLIQFDSAQMCMDEITVPTPESTSVAFWMELLVRKGKAVSLVGPSGAGKSRTVAHLLHRLNDAGTIFADYQRIHMNYFSTAAALSMHLQSCLARRVHVRQGIPTSSARLVVFVDDVNLAQSDDYGERSTDEFIRQHIESNSYFDVNSLSRIALHGIQYVTCVTTRSACAELNWRVQRHFATYALPAMSALSMMTIFYTFLEGHFKKQPFLSTVSDLIPALLKATLAVHKRVCATFRYTAVEYFYRFSARHIARVCRGLLLAQPKSGQFDKPEDILCLWFHEVERSYGDVLASEAKKLEFSELIRTVAKESFSAVKSAEFLLDIDTDTDPEQSVLSSFLFSHVRDSATLKEPSYGHVRDFGEMRATMETAVHERNKGSHPKMDVILHDELLLHVARLMRILFQPGEHALLLGACGTGRHASAELASYLCGYAVLQPFKSTDHSVSDFKSDLKRIFERSGVMEEKIVFLLSDSQVSDDKLLAVVVEIFLTGGVGHLFNTDEKVEIASKIKMRGLAAEATISTCWPIFLRRLQSHLRVIFIASPMSPKFQSRIHRFPAILDCSTIDSFHQWSQRALENIARCQLNSSDVLENSMSPSLREAVLRFMPGIHLMAVSAFEDYNKYGRHSVSVTPRAYLEMLRIFEDRLAAARAANAEKTALLEKGLQKISELSTSLATLEDDLKVWQKDADYKRENRKKAHEKLTAHSLLTETEIAKKSEKVSRVAKLEAEFNRRTKDAEAELALASPAIDEVMSALNAISREDLGECAAMAMPPIGLCEIFSSIMVLLAGIHAGIVVQKNGKVRENDRNWHACKQSLLCNINGLIERLREFKSLIDAGAVPSLNFKEARPYLRLECFSDEVAKSNLPVAASLVRWVRNVIIYYDKWLDVEPKRAKVASVNHLLRDAKADLEKQMTLLTKLQAEQDSLKLDFDKAEAANVTASMLAERGELKLELGQRLLNVLGREQKRWKTELHEANAEREIVFGNVMLASAFVCYCGPLDTKYRDRLVNDAWLPFLETAFPNGNLVSIKAPARAAPAGLGSLFTLPDNFSQLESFDADRTFLENAAIIAWSKRWPLFIDPEHRGIAWVKAHCGNRNANGMSSQCRVLRLTKFLQDQDLRTARYNTLHQIATAIKEGETLIMERLNDDLERVDPALYPLLRNSLSTDSGKLHLRFMDGGLEEIEYNPAFRLYIQTTLKNPKIAIEMQAELTVIEFSLTDRDVENTLSMHILRRSRPEFAEQQAGLLHLKAKLESRERDIEREILALLSSEKVEPAEDRHTVDTFERCTTKKSSLATNITRCRRLATAIDARVDCYRSVAKHGAAMFGVLRRLDSISPYYAMGFSLFVNIFELGLEVIPPSVHQEQQVPFVNSEFQLAADTGPKSHCFDWNFAMQMKPSSNYQSTRRKNSNQRVANAKLTDTPWSGGNKCSDEDLATEVRKLLASDALKDLSPKAGEQELQQNRNTQEIRAITDIMHRLVQRGIQVRDRLAVDTILAFTLAKESSSLTSEEIVHFVTKGTSNCVQRPILKNVSTWLPEAIWDELAALSETVRGPRRLEPLARLCDEINCNAELWREWYEHPIPETIPLPGKLNTMADIGRLCVVRIMRPDRLPPALLAYNRQLLGPVLSPSSKGCLDLKSLYMESSSLNPILFVLSVESENPVSRIAKLGQEFDIGVEHGTFCNVVLGSNTARAIAEDSLGNLSAAGGWLILQNIHLAPQWLPSFEHKLEWATKRASPKFRCFLTLSPLDQKVIRVPETLLAVCMKVADEVPKPLSNSMERAWYCFDQQQIDSSRNSNKYARCLVGLCFFHTLLVCRRHCGVLGWTRQYAFTLTTLQLSGQIIKGIVNSEDTFTTKETSTIAWEKIRRSVGEGLYFGGVNEQWDSKTISNYLSTIFNGSLLDPNAVLADGCPAPETTTDHSLVARHITSKLPFDASDVQSSLSNAIGLQSTGDTKQVASTTARLLGAISNSHDPNCDSSKSRSKAASELMEFIQYFENQLPRKFAGNAIMKVESLTETADAAYSRFLVCECEQANALIDELDRCLNMVHMAMVGKLDACHETKEIITALRLNRLPGSKPTDRVSWIKLSWPTERSLAAWFHDLITRIDQLAMWEARLEVPVILKFAFFNPRALLTAIELCSARTLKLPLDKMAIETHICAFSNTYLAERPTFGVYVENLVCQGARWIEMDSHEYTVDNVRCAGILRDQMPHQLPGATAPLPILYIKGTGVDAGWSIPPPIGDVRVDPSVYGCPVYLTRSRGSTLVFIATLRTDEPVSKWLRGSVAILVEAS